MTTTVSQTLTYTGGAQTVVIPPDITSDVRVTLSGAGGKSYSTSITGGAAGFVDVTLSQAACAGQTLHIYLGGSGPGQQDSGFNGGGPGYDTSLIFAGCGGGGGSDIRLGGTALSNRILVAGGGGGASAGYSGGDGGSATGGNGSSFVAGGYGGGGTQTIGGHWGVAGGGPGGTAATSGSQGQGGDPGRPNNISGYSAGGGGGGGYEGGGGGGAYALNDRGGSGGGGSSYVSDPTVTFVFFNGQGSGVPHDANGQATLTYDKPDTTSTVSLNVTGGMQLAGIETHLAASNTWHATASVVDGGVVTTKRTGATAFNVAASLSVARLPLTFSKVLALNGVGSLSTIGFRSTQQAVAMSAFGQLTVQVTSGVVSIQSFAQLTLGTLLQTTFQQNQMQALASLLQDIDISREEPLSLAGTANLAIQPILQHLGGLEIAANGSVSYVGSISTLGGTSVSVLAKMDLTGQRQIIGVLSVMSAAAFLENLGPIQHPQAIDITSAVSMTLAPSYINIVGLLMSAFATLDIPHVQFSRVLAIHVLPQMLINLDPGGGTYEGPYLTVTDTHNTVQFFVNSYPNPRSVRQKVTNVHSGI